MPEDQTPIYRRLSKKRASAPTAPSQLQENQQSAQQIEELIARIQQKEKELLALNDQAHIIDNLTRKLQNTEVAMQAATRQVEEKALMIDKLQDKLEAQSLLMMTNNEQAELIDDLTGRLQEMEIKLAASSINSQHVAAQNIAKTHMIAGMSLGLLPAPLFDIAALTGTQLNLLRSLSQHYGISFDEQTSKAVVTSLLSGSIPVLTVLGLSSIVKIIPGIGTIGGGISMTVLAGAVIYATGQVFIRHFEAGGTLENFDGKHWQAFFKEQLAEGKAFVRSKVGKTEDKEQPQETTSHQQ